MIQSPWFKVDDGFANSEPVMRVPRRHRASVVGLWALAGTWCAKELTDGQVPGHMIEELSGTHSQAGHLVSCGLWAETPTGYEFIGWSKYQPTRAEVEDARLKEAERKRKYRESRRDTDGTPPSVPLVSQRVSGHPDPTRPDPTIKEQSIVQPKPALSKEFAEWWSVYPRKEGKVSAQKAYTKHRKTTEADVLLKGVQAYALSCIGKEREFIKLPAGWLNDGRWDAEYTQPKPTVSGIQTASVCPHEYPIGACPYCSEGQAF